MLCEVGKQLYGKFKEVHHEQDIAEKEVESGNRGQSELRLTKVQEIEAAAVLAWKRHLLECGTCRVEEGKR
jgi:hypothetical protein